MQTLYTLAFLAGDEPVVFYVGHTNDVERRRGEHTRNPLNPKHAEYDTYKYRWCRDLISAGIEYTLTPILEIDSDDDSEYEWILKFARDNEQRGIEFYDGYPLTNMKAGDFLTEILAIPEINTAEDIREYRNAKAIRAISYERDGGGTGEYTEQGAKHIEEAHRIAEVLAAREQYAKSKKITKTSNPMNEIEVRKQNSLLLKRELEEGCMLWEEYNAEMQRIGYPAWTETRPQLAKK